MFNDDRAARWAAITRALRARHAVRREHGDWLGFTLGAVPVPMVVGRGGPLVEILAGLAPRGAAEPDDLLAACRVLPAGGLVIERGTYLLREVRDLERLGLADLERTIERLWRGAARVRHVLGDRAHGATALFESYAT
jgi:hypothetical protein